MNYYFLEYLPVRIKRFRGAPCTNIEKTKSLAKQATDTVVWQFLKSLDFIDESTLGTREAETGNRARKVSGTQGKMRAS